MTQEGRGIAEDKGTNNDWNTLVGRTVEIRRNNEHIRTAEVEIAAADSTIMWLRSHGNDPRQAILESDGYAIHLVN